MIKCRGFMGCRACRLVIKPWESLVCNPPSLLAASRCCYNQRLPHHQIIKPVAALNL
jgi:hypothetical protein